MHGAEERVGQEPVARHHHEDARLTELEPNRETVVVCHHGVRSAQVAMYLARMGFEHVLNLSGGIDAWSEEADPSTPRY